MLLLCPDWTVNHCITFKRHVRSEEQLSVASYTHQSPTSDAELVLVRDV